MNLYYRGQLLLFEDETLDISNTKLLPATTETSIVKADNNDNTDNSKSNNNIKSTIDIKDINFDFDKIYELSKSKKINVINVAKQMWLGQLNNSENNDNSELLSHTLEDEVKNVLSHVFTINKKNLVIVNKLSGFKLRKNK